jgi:SAM-dependent methyltransferase
MQPHTWEDLISLHSRDVPKFSILNSAAHYRAIDQHTDWTKENLDIDSALAKDTFPLPAVEDREGYYGPHHFSYWASGLRDMRNLLACCARLGVRPKDYYDLGCASGRVVRHFAVNEPDVRIFASDINRRHVEWILQFLPESIIAFQNHSIPTTPLPDNSVDLISAFSVFTHIEAFEAAWLMELRRILRPGGLAWVTVHTEKTWEEMTPDWPLYKGLQNHPEFKALQSGKPLPGERVVFRWKADASYSSNVFYSIDYIRKVWSRYFEIAEFHRRLPVFQDVVVLRKT